MDEIEKLRATVQDERARRYWAERELKNEREKAAIWRRRAEERKGRIAELRGGGSRSGVVRRRAGGFLKRLRRFRAQDVSTGPVVGSSSNSPTTSRDVSEPGAQTVHERARVPSGVASLNPTIRIATLGHPDMAFLDEFEITSIVNGSEGIYSSDAVFVTVSALVRAEESVLDGLGQWLRAEARQPLAVWMDSEVPADSGLGEIIKRADVRLGPPGVHAAAGLDVIPFDAGFDPFVYNPIHWTPILPDDVDEADGMRVLMHAGVPVVAAATRAVIDTQQPARLLAKGVPVFGDEDADASAPLLRVRSGASAVEVAEAVARDEVLLTRMSVLGRRLAFQQFTSGERSLAFLELLDIDPPRRQPSVGALLLSNRPDLIISSARSILRQEDVAIELVVGLHGDQAAFRGVREQIHEMAQDRPIQILEIGGGVTLGAALNRAAEACSCPILAKIDDDDWYGPLYLADALAAMRYSRSDIVGKARYHVEIESTGDTYLIEGPEEAAVSHVIGSSLVFRRRLWEEVPFPHRPSRVDSIFLRGARSVGANIYSNHRFEFGVRRTASGHTWNVDPAFFAARGKRVGDALDGARLNVAFTEIDEIPIR